jgi:hypothetical protein
MESTGLLPLRAPTLAARRADPREHGRQTARSKRDRPGGQATRSTKLAMSAPPQATLIH